MIAKVIISENGQQREACFEVSSKKNAENDINSQLERYNSFALATQFEEQYIEIVEDKEVENTRIASKESEPELIRELVEILTVE